MLVLTRKTDESIVISGGIEIRIARIQGDSVRLAISAPRGIEILRKEILDEVRAANMAASRSDDIEGDLTDILFHKKNKMEK